MNCTDFETIINELARERLLDASERTAGLSHAQACARCAARLRQERALTSGLRTLAESDARREAPARLEATLLSAFRQREKVALLKPAAEGAGRKARLRRSSMGTAAAAAAVSMLFIAALALYMQRPARQPQAVATSRGSQGLTLEAWPGIASNSAQQQARPALLSSAVGASPQLAFERVTGRRRERLEAARPVRLGSIESPQAAAASAADMDIATDFIPLTYGADLSSMDSGRVVRVELPRTALARYGLPMNAERASEPVKADVLLSEDGLAQAIRFVR